MSWRGCTGADATFERQRTMVIRDQAAMQNFTDGKDQDMEAFIIVCIVCDLAQSIQCRARVGCRTPALCHDAHSSGRVKVTADTPARVALHPINTRVTGKQIRYLNTGCCCCGGGGGGGSGGNGGGGAAHVYYRNILYDLKQRYACVKCAAYLG